MIRHILRELEPMKDTAKSFYKKAYVGFDDNTKDYMLYSYNTLIASYNRDSGAVKLTSDYNYSKTTLRHLKEFLYQYADFTGTLKDIETKFIMIPAQLLKLNKGV